MHELDKETTMQEVSKALDRLCSGKSRGSEGISSKVLKCATGFFINAGEKAQYPKTLEMQILLPSTFVESSSVSPESV